MVFNAIEKYIKVNELLIYTHRLQNYHCHDEVFLINQKDIENINRQIYSVSDICVSLSRVPKEDAWNGERASCRHRLAQHPGAYSACFGLYSSSIQLSEVYCEQCTGRNSTRWILLLFVRLSWRHCLENATYKWRN